MPPESVDRPAAGRAAAPILAVLAAVLLADPAGAQGPTGRAVPAVFEHDLVHVMAPAEKGPDLRLCTDTGGGVISVREAPARRAGWLAPGEGGRTIPFPQFRDGTIPAPRGGPSRMRLIPDTMDVPMADSCDGMLGAAWFADRVWTLDYGRGRLLHHPNGLPEDLEGRTAELGFRVDSVGDRVSHFARIDVVVDGDTLPLLLDTGAQFFPTEAARRALGLERRSPGPVATSFIGDTIFARWRREHPEWDVVREAGTMARGEPMIRVPEVEIGGLRIGPVWFMRRLQANFDRIVNPLMDRPVVGALGGSAFRHVRLTISYPEAVAVVTRASG